MTASDLERVSSGLERFLELVLRHPPVAEAVQDLRACTDHAGREVARGALHRALARHGLPVDRTLSTALNHRLLRGGTSPQTDRLFASLLKAWRDLEARLGVAVSLRTFCYLAASDRRPRSHCARLCDASPAIRRPPATSRPSSPVSSGRDPMRCDNGPWRPTTPSVSGATPIPVWCKNSYSYRTPRSSPSASRVGGVARRAPRHPLHGPVDGHPVAGGGPAGSPGPTPRDPDRPRVSAVLPVRGRRLARTATRPPCRSVCANWPDRRGRLAGGVARAASTEVMQYAGGIFPGSPGGLLQVLFITECLRPVRACGSSRRGSPTST